MLNSESDSHLSNTRAIPYVGLATVGGFLFDVADFSQDFGCDIVEVDREFLADQEGGMSNWISLEVFALCSYLMCTRVEVLVEDHDGQMHRTQYQQPVEHGERLLNVHAYTGSRTGVLTIIARFTRLYISADQADAGLGHFDYLQVYTDILSVTYLAVGIVRVMHTCVRY